MKPTGPSLAAALAGLGIGVMYVYLIGTWVLESGLYPQDLLEALVLGALLVRLAAFFFIARVRSLKPAAVVILFGADIYVVLISAGAFAATGYPPFGDFGREFMLSWIGAAPLVYTPLATYFLVRSMRRGSRLSGLLPLAAAFYGVVALATQATVQSTGGGGLKGFALVLVAAVRGGGNLAAGDPVVTIGGGLLFAGLFVWSLAPRAGRDVGDWTVRLGLGAVAVGLAVLWTLFAPEGISPWLIYGGPVAVVIGMVAVAALAS